MYLKRYSYELSCFCMFYDFEFKVLLYSLLSVY